MNLKAVLVAIWLVFVSTIHVAEARALHGGIAASSVTTKRMLVGIANDIGNTQRPNTASVAGSNSANALKYEVAPFDIVDPSIVLTGWTTGNSEANNPNAVTFDYYLFASNKTALLCHFAWSGVAGTKTVNPGETDESDHCSGLTITAGTQFYETCNVSVANSNVFYLSDASFRNPGIGQLVEIGTNLTNKAGSPSTITNGGAFNNPCTGVLMGTTPLGQRSFGILGDSLSVGVGGYIGNDRAIGYIAGYLTSNTVQNYLHLGRSGFSAQLCASGECTMRFGLMGYVGITDMPDELGVNDLFAGNASSATLAGHQATVLSLAVAADTQLANNWLATITPEVNVIAPAPTSECPFTGFISGTTLTVTVAASNCVAINNTIWASDITIATTITSQSGGTSGGVGTYVVDTSQTAGGTGEAIIATNQNNTTGVPANGLDGRVQTYNTLVRAGGVSGQQNFYEAASAIQNTSLPYIYFWTALYSTDGVHPDQAGGAAMVTLMGNDNAFNIN